MRRSLAAATFFAMTALALTACEDGAQGDSNPTASAAKPSDNKTGGGNITLSFDGTGAGQRYHITAKVGSAKKADGEMTVTDSTGQTSRPLKEAAQCLNNSDDLASSIVYPITVETTGGTSDDMSRTISVKATGPDAENLKVVWLNSVIAECDEQVSINRVADGSTTHKEVGFIVSVTGALTKGDGLVLRGPNDDTLSNAVGCTINASNGCEVKLTP